MQKLKQYILNNKEYINIRKIEELSGITKNTLSNWLGTGKELPQHHIYPLLGALVKYRGGILIIGDHFIQESDDEFLVWSIAETLPSIMVEEGTASYIKYPVILSKFIADEWSIRAYI